MDSPVSKMEKRKISRHLQSHALRLWDYCTLVPESRKSGFMVVFGCQDVGVPQHAAALLEIEKAPIAVVSGNKGIVTSGHKMNSEASYFKAVMTKKVDEEKILVEEKATHSIENIRLSRIEFSKSQRYIDFTSGIAVTKPYSSRRIAAIVRKQWGSVDWHIESQKMSYKEYCGQDERYEELTIHFLVGEITRLSSNNGMAYMEQSIPDIVWRSYYELKASGFDIDGDIAKCDAAPGLSRKDWLSELAIDRLKTAAAS